MAVEPSDDDNSYSEFVDALESTGGKAFAEFMACEAGADFNAENATKMISDWQKLITAESLFGVWGYVPAADTNAFGDTLWWELNWNSKEEADAEWSAWVENEDAQAWAEQYSNVMIDMLYDKKYYDKCSSNSIKRYNEVYKLETVIKKYIDIYKEVANA